MAKRGRPSNEELARRAAEEAAETEEDEAEAAEPEVGDDVPVAPALPGVVLLDLSIGNVGKLWTVEEGKLVEIPHEGPEYVQLLNMRPGVRETRRVAVDECR